MIRPIEEFDIGWFDTQLREYQKNKDFIEKTKKNKRDEIEYVTNFWNAKLMRLQQDQEIIKADLANYLDQFGATSQTTAFGNVHLAKTQSKIDWGTAKSQRELAESIPDEFTRKSLNKSALKDALAVSSDGKVYWKDTGELVKGLTGEQGGEKTIVIRKGDKS